MQHDLPMPFIRPGHFDLTSGLARFDLDASRHDKTFCAFLYFVVLNIFLYPSFNSKLQKNVEITKKQLLCLARLKKVKMWPKIVKLRMTGLAAP